MFVQIWSQDGGAVADVAAVWDEAKAAYREVAVGVANIKVISMPLFSLNVYFRGLAYGLLAS